MSRTPPPPTEPRSFAEEPARDRLRSAEPARRHFGAEFRHDPSEREERRLQP